MLPNPAEPAVPCTTVPEVKVSAQFVSPSCFKPCGFGKFAMASCPELRGAAVGVDRRHDAGGIDRHRAELAGGEAVLGDRGHAELPPYCVVWPKLKVMFIGARRPAGRSR